MNETTNQPPFGRLNSLPAQSGKWERALDARTNAARADPLHEWREVERDGPHATMRMRVPGGWLYRLSGLNPMVFVPAPVPGKE